MKSKNKQTWRTGVYEAAVSYLSDTFNSLYMPSIHAEL